MKIKRKIKMLILMLLVLMAFSGCRNKSDSSESSPQSRTRFVLGTTVTIQLYDNEPDEVFSKVFERLSDIEEKMTINKDTSEVILLNSSAGKDFVKVSEDTYSVIKEGIEFSKLSDGKFDISIGPLVKLWNIGTESARVPSPEEIEEKKLLVGYENITVDDSGNRVMLEKEGMMLDLGGIAKGYAADEVVNLLKSQGIERAIINIGGNVFAMGEKPDGSKWRIGIQNPFSTRGEYLGIVDISDKTVVTSGIYERYFEQDGKRYHHILDANTGYPVENELAGVSIVAEKSIDADALSTAAFSAGVKEGMNLIEAYEGADAIFITKEHEIYTTSGLEENFSLTDGNFTIVEQ